MNEFKSWEEMSELEQAQSMFWDMYKDAHGFRPRGLDTSKWTLEDFCVQFELLGKIIDREEQDRLADESAAVKKFEQHVVDTINMGAGNRETALRWIMEASDAAGDWEYFCYLNGLPYSYFRQVVKSVE